MTAHKGNEETSANELERALSVLDEHLAVELMLAEHTTGRVLFKSNRTEILLSKGKAHLETLLEAVSRGDEDVIAGTMVLPDSEPPVNVRGVRLSGTSVLLMLRALDVDRTIARGRGEPPPNSWRVAAWRRFDARFVGRRDELARLEAKLALAQTTPTIVWITGHGGVGKSMLARRFLATAEKPLRRIVWLSGDELAATPASFEAAVTAALDPSAPALGTSQDADVLVVDAFDSLEAIGPWLFRCFLPTLGPRLLVLLTTRDRPSPTLRAELSISAELDELRLAYFDRVESARQLRLDGVPEDEHDAIHAFTHGHPFALALVGERYRGEATSRPTVVEPDDVMDALARRCLREPISPRERDALYVLALAHVTDEELLASVVGRECAPVVYERFARLSFVEATAHGLVPHPFMRSIVRQDFRTRTPERADEIRRVLVTRLVARLSAAESFQRIRQWLLDALFVRRDEPILRAMHLDRIVRTHVRLAEKSEIPMLSAHVARFEGAESAALFRHFAERQPENLYVVVEREPGPAAIVFPIALSRCTDEDLALDPALARLQVLCGGGRVRPDADVQVLRWFFTTKSHQKIDEHTASLMMLGPFLAAPHVDRVRFVVCMMTDGEAWEPITAPMGFQRRRDLEAQDTPDPRAFFVQDYRAFVGEERHPLRALERTLVHVLRGFGGLGGLATQGAADGGGPTRDEFEELVRVALTELHAPHALARSRFVATAVGRHALEGDGIVALFRDVLAELDAAHQYADSAAVLHATFFEPAGKQEAAAAALGIPFGTYRYRLRKAIACFADALWQKELQTRAASGPVLRFTVRQLRQRFDIE